MPHKDQRTVYIVGLCVVCINVHVESVAQVHIKFIAITFCIRLESSHPALAAIFQRRQKQRDG